MLELKRKIAEAIIGRVLEIKADAELSAADIIGMLEYPPDEKMGDLALPCFKLSKILRNAPVKIAIELSGVLSIEGVARAEAVNGYLNIFLDGQALANRVIPEVREKGDRYGAPDLGQGKTVVLDYSSPNVAKPFHIGHLGTTVIGHALKKMHEFAGYSCVGLNYLGDWGTQFGKLIVAYRAWGNRELIENGGIDKLVELYVRFHEEAEKNPALNDEARAEFRRLEEGNEDNIALWTWFVEISLKE